jgi:hypothetical protein
MQEYERMPQRLLGSVFQVRRNLERLRSELRRKLPDEFLGDGPRPQGRLYYLRRDELGIGSRFTA